MYIVDSVIKLGQRKHKDCVLYCDLLQQHNCMKMNSHGVPAFASPPTKDSAFYNSQDPSFFFDPKDKLWKGQTTTQSKRKVDANNPKTGIDALI